MTVKVICLFVYHDVEYTRRLHRMKKLSRVLNFNTRLGFQPPSVCCRCAGRGASLQSRCGVLSRLLLRQSLFHRLCNGCGVDISCRTQLCDDALPDFDRLVLTQFGCALDICDIDAKSDDGV